MTVRTTQQPSTNDGRGKGVPRKPNIGIYLAGKIRKNDWRTGRYPIKSAWDALDHRGSGPWPIVREHVHGMDYVGPFFMSCDHGCAHGPETHGVGAGDVVEGAYPAPSRSEVIMRCLNAIERADIFFAWFGAEQDCDKNHVTAYGTLTELGYAKALKKTIVVALPEDSRHTVEVIDPDHGGWLDQEANPNGELWFALQCASEVIIADDPWNALQQVADNYATRLESPLEQAFWRAHIRARRPSLDGLITQHEVRANGKTYRLDFALPEKQIAFEMDGYTYHSSREAWAKDRRRDLDLATIGWRIHRFDGDLVRDRAETAVETAAKLAEAKS